MTGTEEEFLRALRATFKVEASEHLQTIGTGLLELEKAAAPPEQLKLVETVFRAAHSLKGAARAVGLTDVESFCQSLEDLFAKWKRHESLPTADALDSAHHTVDEISLALTEPAATSRTARESEAASIAAASPQAQAAPALPHAPALTGESETVRVAVSSLDARLLEAEELLGAKLAAGQRAADLGALASRFEQWHKEWSRVESRAPLLRQAMARPTEAAGPEWSEVAEFFTWNQGYLRALESTVRALQRTAEQDRILIGKWVDDLLENSKKLLMLPLATLGGLLAKLVRDLCRDQGKEAELVIRGEETTIDKRILEELKDPLVHLLRNCIDHGIETPERRRRAGKPPRATLTLEVLRVNGNQVEISVSDDGAGVDVERVKEAAAKRGLVMPNASEQLAQSAALALVFETDVSTSPMITQVSGRGLGLAIVREKVEKLGGRVGIESRRGHGTTIRMTLPLTLATFRGVLIEVAQRLFVIPTAQVERAARFMLRDVQTVEGRRTLVLNGRAVALVDLSEVLQLPATRHKPDRPEATPILVLGAGEQRVAFAVDSVLDEREVLVKRLTKPLSRVRNIAGATVLSSGQVAPILNVPDLLKSARTAGAASSMPVPAQPSAVTAKRILVAEDSITSRVLLKGILESAGYFVKTAVDGIDAYTSLRSESYDLLVSDVEMPRLNGFDLTARIRADARLAELPVVLVTALESRQDRERGVDVGANAYLVKSGLDQGNLLEAVRRLA